MEVRTRKADGTVTKALNMNGPFTSRRQPLRLIAKTPDGKLVLQGAHDFKIVTTDLYGRRVHSSTGQLSTLQYVFNGSSPDDVPTDASRVRVDYNIGDLVYTLRPLSKQCKIHVGRVEGFLPGGATNIRIAPESRAWMANLDNGGRKKELLKVPNAVVFKSAAKIRAFLDKFDEDLERAAKLFDNLNGTRS